MLLIELLGRKLLKKKFFSFEDIKGPCLAHYICFHFIFVSPIDLLLWFPGLKTLVPGGTRTVDFPHQRRLPHLLERLFFLRLARILIFKLRFQMVQFFDWFATWICPGFKPATLLK